ncbi:MAG: hypothetical protein ACRC5T_01275, partial [Cetobacterium sp.]
SAYEIIEIDEQEQQKPVKEDGIKNYFLELLEKAVPQEKIKEVKEKLKISNFSEYDSKKLARLLDKLGVEHYKVENGKAYHATKSCTSLRKSKNIKAVAISEVGNRKPCRFKNCK